MRMLLSHNFDVSPQDFPPLSREAFTEVFQKGLSIHEAIQCQLVDHPHWIVEIRFPEDQITSKQVGELCAKALAEQRKTRHPQNAMPHILVLGGLKTTAPTSNSPATLQSGDWGVDVVETANSEVFLQKIDWTMMAGQRPPDNIFKVELKDA